MEKGKKDAILLTVIAIATLLVAIVGATFAFFTARVTNNSTQSTLTIRSASGGSTSYTGGDTINVQNIYPREEAWVTKPIKVTYNNANAAYDYQYRLVLHYTNSFNNGELEYSLAPATGYCTNGTALTQATCTGTGVSWETNIASGTVTSTSGRFSSTPVDITLGTGTFSPSASAQTHAYILTISYPDTNKNQNYAQYENGTESNVAATNQNKALTAWISIEEVNA